MSITEEHFVYDILRSPKRTQYRVFTELFNVLPSKTLAKKLVDQFADKEIEEFIAELQKQMKKEQTT